MLRNCIYMLRWSRNYTLYRTLKCAIAFTDTRRWLLYRGSWTILQSHNICVLNVQLACLKRKLGVTEVVFNGKPLQSRGYTLQVRVLNGTCLQRGKKGSLRFRCRQVLLYWNVVVWPSVAIPIGLSAQVLSHSLKTCKGDGPSGHYNFIVILYVNFHAL